MSHTTTILEEIEQFMKENGLNISQLAKRCGMNAGTVSSILNNKRVLAVDQLDRITATMSLPQGYFYEHYLQQYLSNVALNWRRIKPFLYRCAKLDKLQCVRLTVNLLMDNLLYLSSLLEVAEDFFTQGKSTTAAILYESIALSEKNQHSERLAFCQYRLFLIRLGSDLEQNYQAALQFEPFAERLHESDQLDALHDLANTFRSLLRWDKVYSTAMKLSHLAKAQYSLSGSSGRNVSATQKKPLKPLFFYVAYSNLLIGNFYHDQGNYNLALQKATEYAHLDWVNETDKETVHWKHQFQAWGNANMSLARLMSGDINILTEYVALIQAENIEVIYGLQNIMIVANRFNVDVDAVLAKFESDIYGEQAASVQYVRLLTELAQYHLAKGRTNNGFRYLLNGLKAATLMHDESSMLRCIRLFERLRETAAAEIKLEYRNLLNIEENYGTSSAV